MQHYIDKANKIYVYAMPVIDSRMYVIINDQNDREALIIDPLCCKEVTEIIQNLNQATVLLTHSHYDHISGVNWLKDRLDCTVFCSDICAKKIMNEYENLAAFAPTLIIDKTDEEQSECMSYFDLKYTCKADKIFEKETSFNFGSYIVKIIYTPGHSDCSQCIQLTTTKKGLAPIIVFTGDSLVNGHKVITKLPSGNKKQYRLMTKPYLDTLPNHTLIMPGHGDWDIKRNFEEI